MIIGGVNVRRKANDLKGKESMTKAQALVSRRTFLSSVAATGTAVIWPTTLPSAEAWLQESVPVQPALPPATGQEAGYEWYARQYTDPAIFTAIGLPADPAEAAVSPKGELLGANDLVIQGTKYKDRDIPGTGYARNSLAFALYIEGKVVPIGLGEDARQSLEKGYLPIVITEWEHGDLEIRQTTFSEPLKGVEYRSGLESTLAWAVFEVTNHGNAACPVTLLAALMGDEGNLRRELNYRGGAVMEKGSALFSAQLPTGFAAEFQPVFPVSARATADADQLGLLRSYAGVFNALAVQGRIEAGETVRMAFNRRLDFPAALHWGPGPQAAVVPEELTRRSPQRALESARATWSGLSQKVARFVTPDPVLNNIVNKAMLDGYFLTKRWNGKYIVFDSVCYRCQWDDSSTKWFYALDVMGDHSTSERLLDTVFERQGQRRPAGMQTREGCFSDVTNTTRDGSDAAWASCNGWALWAMAEHARFTHDSGWIDKHKQQILDGCEWIRRERQFSKETPNNPCAGLIYGKFCCDFPDQGNPSGVGYFTYTDAISYMGIHSMGELLAEWAHPEGASLLKEAELYRTDIIAAIDSLTDKSQDPWYVPWVLHAPKYIDRYFYEAAGPTYLPTGGVFLPEDVRIQHVIRWINDRTHHGSLEEAAAGSKDATEGAMFYTQDLGIALLELGRVDDFLRIFYTLLAANISHETLTTCEWRSNTQPHVHSVASLIRMFRTMMIQERGGALYLLQGIPRGWWEQGKVLKITEAPTWYGPISLETWSQVEVAKVGARITLPNRLASTPVNLRLSLPDGRRIKRVQVNGEEHPSLEGEWIILKGVTGIAEIVAYTA
jgi:hypothetical protein